MISALFCSVNPRGVINLLLLLSLVIHERLHGCAGSFCPEQNHTTKQNCMLRVYILMMVVLTEIICSNKYTVHLKEKHNFFHYTVVMSLAIVCQNAHHTPA